MKNLLACGAATAGMVALTGGGEAPVSAIGARGPLRPPGALPEQAFRSRCIRCQRCADACPNQAILPMGTGAAALSGTPVIFARRQACMLCNQVEGDQLKCTAACPSGALTPISKDAETILSKVAMGTAVVDRQLCYSYNNWSCGACFRACPFPGAAMKLGMWERPEVMAEVCVGCGLCERACIRYPQAIRVQPKPGVGV